MPFAPSITPEHQKQLNSLTGMRFLAAVSVLFFHLNNETWHDGARGFNLGMGLFGKGYMGVDFFFVLSGYILAFAHQDMAAGSLSRKSFFDFMLRRFARVYPAYLVALVPWIAVEFLKMSGAIAMAPSAPETLYGLWVSTPPFSGYWSVFKLVVTSLMLQATGIDLALWNGPGWSVSAEMFSYAALPFIWFLLSQRSVAWKFVVAVVLVCGIGVYANLRGGTLHVFTGSIAIRCLLEVMLGTCVFYIYQRNILRSLFLSAWCPIATVVAIVFIARYGYRLQLSDATFIPGFCVLILSLAHRDTAGKNSIIGNVKYLGEISFCLYLLHYFFILLAQSFLANFYPHIIGIHYSLAMMAMVFPSSLLGAVYLHYIVEVPFRRFITNGTFTRHFYLGIKKPV